jgi:hypothetical protein
MAYHGCERLAGAIKSARPSFLKKRSKKLLVRGAHAGRTTRANL